MHSIPMLAIVIFIIQASRSHYAPTPCHVATLKYLISGAVPGRVALPHRGENAMIAAAIRHSSVEAL
jgi:hypothetical protein